MTDKYNIGIDLGTTKCAVSVFVNGRIRSIPIDNGMKLLHSCIYVGDDTMTYGRNAKLKQQSEPKRVIYGMKRMMGHRYDDHEFQEDLTSIPFDVERGESGEIIISVDINGVTKTFFPTELSAYLISQAVKCASEYLHGTISEAVITVPAYFNNIQRNDTINAGIIAGLDNVHLFSEPTAATIAYGLINPCKEEMILVFDFGGGALDVSIIQVTNKTYNVMSCCGDSHLGGNDITNNIMKEVVATLNKTFNVTLSVESVDWILLHNAVEEAKIALSSVDSYDIDIENIMGNEFHYTITRAMLENCNKELFDSSFSKISDALKKAFLEKETITHVILVGGSSNIPYIRDKISEYFGKEKVYSSINTSEAVSQGAAVIAGISRDVVEKGFDFQVSMYTTAHNIGNKDATTVTINDITPMDIGIRVSTGKLSAIIPSNSSIPCTMRKEYQAHKDYQRNLKFKIYQGLDELAANCTIVNEIVVPIDTPGLASETIVEVSFSLDSNSTLYVEAIEQKTLKSVSRIMDMGSMVLPRETVFQKRDALRESVLRSDMNEKAMVARSAMMRFCLQIQNYLGSLGNDDDIEKKKVYLNECRTWLAENTNASKDDIEVKQKELNSVVYGV